MDNFTHSLIGITFGHAVDRDRSVAVERRALVATSVVASNLGDLDFIVRWLTEDGKFAYLLHHRGYTHTLLLLPLMALASAYLGPWLSRTKVSGSRTRWGLFGVAAVAGLLHILADAMNDYGVHPFSPFWNRWFYGDFMFILEPMLWLGMIPLAVLEAQTRWSKVLWSSLAVLILGVAFLAPITSAPVAIWLVLWFVFFGFLQKWKGGVIPPFVAVFLTVVLFGSGAGVAKWIAREELGRAAPREKAYEIGTSPAPSNPLCWRLLSLSTDPDLSYIARLGVVSLAPEWVSPATCYERIQGDRTAPLTPVTLQTGPAIHWKGEFRSSFARMRSLMDQSCHFSYLLGFTRAPFWTAEVAGDLRYDREKGLGFTEIYLDPGRACSGILPRWEMPVFRNLVK